jgi:hypothetical protein
MRLNEVLRPEANILNQKPAFKGAFRQILAVSMTRHFAWQGEIMNPQDGNGREVALKT